MDLAETFDRLNLDEINDYLARGQEEHLQLDFKTIKSASLASADDRRTLAKGISGFANSAGGIILWGIDARQNDQGIDCAVAAVEIQDLKLFLSRLNEFTGQAVSPIVDGIKHKIIARTAFTGFAATLVPESQSSPHMAKLSEDRYYKRSGASFYKMEHFDLEDMFGRRQKPRLSVIIEPVKIDNGIEEYTILVRNEGRAVARPPCRSPADNIAPYQSANLYCRPLAAVVIKPVSADSLRKTGIFADKAGDFRRFPPEDRQTGSPETKSNARKAGMSIGVGLGPPYRHPKGTPLNGEFGR